MKKLFTITIISLMFLFIGKTSFAQDSAKDSAIKHINETSEEADKLVGKKIQKQSLSTVSFEKTNTIPSNVAKAKSCKKYRHKHKTPNNKTDSLK